MRVILPLGTYIADIDAMSNHHAAVWLNHTEARIFHVDAEALDGPVLYSVVTSPKAYITLHRKSDSENLPDAVENPSYYQAVAEALADADAVLVLGPCTAKLELIKYAHGHDRQLEARFIGVTTVHHPTHGQIAAYVRRYFAPAGWMATA